MRKNLSAPFCPTLLRVMTFTLSLMSASIYAKGQLTYSYMGRINTPLVENIGNQFVEFDLYEEVDKNQDWDGVYSAHFRHYPGAQSQIFSVPEAYIEKRMGAHEWSIGRKIINWQRNDKFWALGEVNPIKAFNLIETQREGLMGIHYRWKSSSRWEFMAQFSPLHIPQVNPTFSAEDGEVVGKNEWSYPPPEFVRFRGNEVPIHYTLVYPDMKELLLKTSASFSLAYHFDQARIGIYGGYKPETGIRINATGFYEQFDEERALVKAKPFVNNHYFWGGSFDYQFNSRNDPDAWISSLGVEGVVPEIGNDESFEFQALKIQPEYERLTYTTWSLDYESDLFNLGLNALYLIDGDRVNTNVFAKKPKWRRAVGLTASWSPLSSVYLNTLYRYDIKTADMTFMSEARYEWSKHISLTAGVQIVDAPEDHSFWAPYRSNDTIYSRLGFIF
ncbi:MAG: hypothetical protein CME63_11380 [Halobacteriovoraceae bacterium]|nr:hypothetical protein [Halobacteriovoraceae bacterium]|tara:strand:+ start:2371 stop:3708 length:1338 start_codon:yes stop_codon:yes gene_type:complete